MTAGTSTTRARQLAANAGADRGDLKSASGEFFMLAMAILSIANLPLLILFPYESHSWYLVMFVPSSKWSAVLELFFE